MIDRVVIVGGGTAGWMTAAYLRAAFGDKVSVTLVESATEGRIGVGEATFSTLRHFIEYLGLREKDWMPACNATYKLAIRFENWRDRGHHFYHPFERTRVVDGFTLAEWWLAYGETDRFDKETFLIATLGDHKRSPRFLDGSLFEGDIPEEGEHATRTTLTEQAAQIPYAYHFDAALFARHLTQMGVEGGVQHVLDDVTDVKLDERGWISEIETKEHGALAGDLFVDCTGFRGLLLNKALGEPFVSFQETLPNDSAVALRVPVDTEREGIKPYTTATAQDAGWIWTIPLFDRIGTGYVYASDYCSPDEAERTLREFVGPAAEGLEPNHLKMRVGRSRNSWVNNCVAIGLASGFVEPLESTGIFFIQHGIEQLVKHFPSERWEPALADAYNGLVARCIDGVHEFLVLHYYAAARADNAYWKATKERELPERLRERLDGWHYRLPDSETIWPYYHGFEAYSYTAMLLGLGGFECRPRPALSLIDPSAAKRELAEVAREAERLAVELPSHYEFLASLRA